MMKKRLLLMGIFAVVCALVAGAILLISKIEPKPEPGTDTGIEDFLSVTDEGIRVYRFSPSNVDYMEISNTHETYRVRMKDGEVVVVGYEGVPLLSASSSGLFKSVETLTLKTVVDEDCEDLSRFGLTAPQATITIQAYSDARITFFIGDASPTGESYYFSVEGERKVYLVEGFLAERYLKSIAEYCDKKIYKTFVPLEDFSALTIKSPKHNYSFRKATAEEQAANGIYFSGIAMEAPFAWGVDSEQMEALMQTMVELTADSVEAMCVGESSLSRYGLDAASRTEISLSVYADPNPTMYNNKANPYFDSSQPTGVYSDFTVTYWLGNTVDKQCYVMFDGCPVVYTIPADTFSWLEWTPYRYCMKMLFGEPISNLSSLSVITEKENLTFTLSGADSNDKDDLRVFCGDVSVDGSLFRTFYANVMAIYPSGEGFMPENAGEPELEIGYALKDGSSHSIRFYPMDDRNYAVNIDGQTFLSVRVTEIQKIVNDAQKLLKGQPIM